MAPPTTPAPITKISLLSLRSDHPTSLIMIEGKDGICSNKNYIKKL